MDTPSSSSNPPPEDANKDHLQKLVDYFSNLSILMIDLDKDHLYKELAKPANTEIVRQFQKDPNTKLVCITKSDEDVQNEDERTIFIETELSYKAIKTSTIIFIKKVPVLNCENASLIKKQLQILNFSSEGNDNSVFLYMQNYIQSAFSPLFNSFQAAVGGEANPSATIKSTNLSTVQTKMNELVVLLSQAQKNSNIPNVKLEWDPDLKVKMDEIRAKKGSEPTVEELGANYNDDYITKLCDIINRWKVDISQVLKLDRNIQQGDTLEELNFWRDYETTLKNVKTQIEGPEVQMTLALVRNARKFFVTKGFEEDTKMDEPIKRVEMYNTLLKDLPIVAMTTATNISDIGNYIHMIFEQIRNKMKISYYPVARMTQLIEVISKDLNAHLINVLGPKLMTMNYDDFIKLYKECKVLFKEAWIKDYEALKKEIPIIQKLRNERSLINVPTTFDHYALSKRLKELKKFRQEHNNLIEIILSLTQSENENQAESPLSREITLAYNKASEIQILDLTKQGDINWVNARHE